MYAKKIDIVSKYKDVRGGMNKFFESSDQFGVSQLLVSNTYKAKTFRGLHCQIGEYSEEKIILCNSGNLIWVAVDFSKFSASGAFVEKHLHFKAGEAIRVPPNCLNGMLSLTDNVSLTILASRTYRPDKGINVNPLGQHFLQEFCTNYKLENAIREVPPDEISQDKFERLISND